MNTARKVFHGMAMACLCWVVTSNVSATTQTQQQTTAWNNFVDWQGGYWKCTWDSSGGLGYAYGRPSAATSTPHKQIAEQFLDSLKPTFFISSITQDLEFADSVVIDLGQNSVVGYSWHQLLNGIRVVPGQVSVNMTDSGRIYNVCAATTNPDLPFDYSSAILSAAEADSIFKDSIDLPSSAASKTTLSYVAVSDSNLLVWLVNVDPSARDNQGNFTQYNCGAVRQSGEIIEVGDARSFRG